ncbi:glycosyltransferase [Curtobacterium sp. MCBA15_008]|uniref:glycosyltransferase n=1 Tax=Curtobacterium sp. MCBA15_008 TaxID=1898736 RepID=UPI0008DEA221|nr:glycosyltransferase [Curtobacterium sp. MCBA15_008]OII09023.1 hypothetical protein BIU96_03730 [Curtobacterium sp. MCBA15_008]
MRILVSVGTHEQPFERLLDAVAATIDQRPQDEWIVQFGVGSWHVRTDRVTAADYLDADAMRDALEWSDLLVSQSSPGNVFGALAAGTWPLVLGRSHAAGEHVDDHQIRFARALQELGYATDVGSPDHLAELVAAESSSAPLDRAERTRTAARRARDNERAFRSDVWRVLRDRS